MQLRLEVARTWGGARKGAGTKAARATSMPHATRPKLDPRCPLRVDDRATPELPSLQSARVFGALGAPSRGSRSMTFAWYVSIQQDHGHCSVEGDEVCACPRRCAWARYWIGARGQPRPGRRGKVVGDRYHARPLTTPRQMRASMVYVLLNFRKHLRAPACVDPRSSGRIFRGGIAPRWPLTSRRRRRYRGPGWRVSAGGARAGRWGWKNTRLPRRDRDRLDSADVAPRRTARVVATGLGGKAARRMTRETRASGRGAGGRRAHVAPRAGSRSAASPASSPSCTSMASRS